MKRFAIFTILLSTILLLGCSRTQTEEPKAELGRISQEKKPNIPKQKALKASVLEFAVTKENDTDILLAQIEKTVSTSRITEEDIKRGYYFGSKEDKKLGTPTGWEWKYDEGESRWANSDGEEKFQKDKDTKLCEATGGIFVYSCLDSEDASCQYISKTGCQCSGEALWNSQQGCILNEVEISVEDILQGWYRGEKYEKKLNTPQGWSWSIENGRPRWHNTK